MNKKQIIIGTTSINRPVLHSDNIPDWYQWINTVDKNVYELTWFINVDWIEKLKSSIEETKLNYKDIIKDENIKLFFLESESPKGNFLEACKRVSSNIEKFVELNKFNPTNVIIIWLEDDWKLNPTIIPLQTLIENYLSNLTSINLSFIRSNYIHALAPSIVSYELWSKLHLIAWKNQLTHIDPEHCAGLYFIQNFSKYEQINNITVISGNEIQKNLDPTKFLNSEKSFYTYNLVDGGGGGDGDVDIKMDLIFNSKYIKKEEVKDFCKDIITFIRIKPSFCIDGVNYGRNFMKDYDIIKKRIQNENQIDFYNINNKN